MTQPELKSCPFCGNVKVHVGHLSESDIIADDWFVECDKPEGCGMSLYAIHRTRDKAISAWNRRTADPVKQALADALKDMRLRWGNSRPCSDPTCLVCPKEIATTKAADAALKAYREEQAQ